MVPGDVCQATLTISSAATDLDINYNVQISGTQATGGSPATADTNLNANLVAKVTSGACVMGAPTAPVSMPALNAATPATLYGSATLATSGGVVLNAGATDSLCLTIALPAGNGDLPGVSGVAAYTAQNAASVQGGNVRYTIYVNARSTQG